MEPLSPQISPHKKQDSTLTPVYIPEDRRAIYDEMFGMYDLDSSGLIDAAEEVRGLMVNLWFKTMAESEAVASGESGRVVEGYTKQLIADIENGRAFDKEGWAEWFETNVYLVHNRAALQPYHKQHREAVLQSMQKIDEIDL